LGEGGLWDGSCVFRWMMSTTEMLSFFFILPGLSLSILIYNRRAPSRSRSDPAKSEFRHSGCYNRKLGRNSAIFVLTLSSM
jgi:hypothetical protein